MNQHGVPLRYYCGFGLALILLLPVSTSWAQGAMTSQTSDVPVMLAEPLQQNNLTAVTKSAMNLRDKPGNGAVIGWIPSGKTVSILGRNGSGQWVFVEYGAKRGWLAAWWLTISGDLGTVPVIDQTGSATGGTTSPASVASALPGSITATAKTTMNIRSGPGASYEILAHLPDGAVIPVLGRNRASSWILIEHGATRGWVARWLCRIAGNLADVPITDQTGSAIQTPPTPLTKQSTGSYTVHLAGIGVNLQGIYQRGQQIGNRPNAFSKVGDCESASPAFLQPIASNHYNLGQYAYLQNTIDFFAPSDSWSHVGQASNPGFTSSSVLDPRWAAPSLCRSGETPLACEYRTHRPAVALIMIRTGDFDTGPNSPYYRYLRAIVQYSIDQGVIPVLGTMAYWGPDHPSTESMNETVRTVARQFNVPLWDFWVTAETLPGHGVNASFHLTSPDAWWAVYLTPNLMEYGMVHYNLEALEVLDAIKNQVTQP